MADEHKKQAAALLAAIDELEVLPHPQRTRREMEESRDQRRRDLLAEAQVHATLQVADEISLLVAATTR